MNVTPAFRCKLLYALYMKDLLRGHLLLLQFIKLYQKIIHLQAVEDCITVGVDSRQEGVVFSWKKLVQ